MNFILFYRNNLILWIIGLYLIFNYGFMQLRFPWNSGQGVPIGELILLGYLLTIHFPKLLGRMSAIVPFIPFLLWWGYGFFRAIQGFSVHGLWAFRDATHIIESLFLLVGFAYAANWQNLNRFYKWLPWVLAITCVYSLGYPFKTFLSTLSPVFPGGSGQPVPIFFMYTNTSMLLLLTIFYLLIFKRFVGWQGWKFLSIIVALFIYTIFQFQARIIYIELIIALLFLTIYRRRILGRFSFIFAFFLLFALALPFVGLDIKGRLNQSVNLVFLAKHFMATAGVASVGLEGAAGGVAQRIGWWIQIFQNWSASIWSMLFGLGFGMPLTDFQVANDITVREPHNSLISIISRMGIVGIFLFFTVQFILFRTWHKAYSIATKLKSREVQNWLLITFIFFIQVIVISFAEDGFEKPFFAIPYYFFWGVILRLYDHLRNTVTAGQEKPNHANLTDS